MRIDELVLNDFRTYADLKVSFSDTINVITGRNAQGKTNLLEAVYYLTGSGSFRASNDGELIRFGAEESVIEARVDSGGREQNIRIGFGNGRKKKIQVNGVSLRSPSELAGRFTAVLFSPEDLAVIQSSPAHRRRLLDSCLCQIRPRYASCLTEYRRLYERKTRILRDRDPDMLRVLREFSDRMCETGAVIVHYRASLSRLLAEIAGETHRDFSGGAEELALTYKTVRTVTDPEGDPSAILPMLREHMLALEDAELAAGRCLSGIHKDDLIVAVNGQDARRSASQGQARTTAISLKMAEREILKRDTGEYPVLLLDDVLSELDAGRQNFILNRIGGGQVLITCCEDRSVAEKTGGRVFIVENGSVREES